jgi:hypothetical protein
VPQRPILEFRRSAVCSQDHRNRMPICGTCIILLFRACLATVIMFTFFVAGEQELSASLETYCVYQTVESSFTTERERDNAVLPRSENSYVNLHDAAHHGIAELLGYFDATRTKFSAGKIPDKRWAISMHEPTTNLTLDTLTAWLHRVLRAVHEQHLEGFAWTSHSLRKCVATASYNIGTPM